MIRTAAPAAAAGEGRRKADDAPAEETILTMDDSRGRGRSSGALEGTRHALTGIV